MFFLRRWWRPNQSYKISEYGPTFVRCQESRLEMNANVSLFAGCVDKHDYLHYI